MNRIEHIQSLLESTPEDSFLQHALALEYVKKGDDLAARDLFEQILNREPSYVGSYLHLGKLLERQGEPEQALQWYERGLKACKEAGDNHSYNELMAAYEDLSY